MKLTKMPKILRAPKLSDQVADFLISEIERGAFKLGELLPSEADLSEQFNVSRTVIREALVRLKYDGLLESNQGSKSKVAAESAKLAFRMKKLDANNFIEIGYLYEFRAILESEAAAMAANRRTEDDLKNMKSLIEAMDKACQDADDATNENVKFHKAITKASKNPFLSDFMNFLGNKILDLVQADRDFSQHVGLPLEVQNEHIILFEAISQQKPEKARKAVLLHLKNAAKRRGATIFQ